MAHPTTICSDHVEPSKLPDHFTRKAGVVWDDFPSDDPNIKVLIDAVRDKHVVFLLNCDSNESVRTAPARNIALPVGIRALVLTLSYMV